MKTTLISIFTAILLGFASVASGHVVNVPDSIAILFATGLTAWTIAQYSRPSRVLAAVRPIRLPIKLPLPAPREAACRLAA